MLRRAKHALVSLVIAGFVLAPTTGWADTACDAPILDQTSRQILANDDGRILAAVQRLESLGIEVRVRALDATPRSNTDVYRDLMIDRCSSWRGTDGDLLEDMVVFYVGLDRKSAIYYGDVLASYLDSRYENIRTNAMGPRFREGNYAVGMVDAANAVYQVVDSARSPSGGGAGDPGMRTGSGVSGATVLVIAAVVGGLILVALIVGLIVSARSRGRRLAEIKAELSEELTRSGMIYAGLDTLQKQVESEVALIAPQLDAATAGDLQQTLATAIEGASAAYAEYTTMIAAVDPTDDDSVQCESRLAVAHDVADRGQEAQKQLEAVQVRCDELQVGINDAQSELERLTAALPEQEELSTAMSGHGFDLDEVDRRLEGVASDLDKARSLVEASKAGQAVDDLERADVSLNEAMVLLADMKDIVQGLPDDVRQLRETIRATEVDIASYKGNHERTLESLTALGAQVDAIGASASRAKPNYADLNQQLLQANADAEKLADVARAKHDKLVAAAEERQREAQVQRDRRSSGDSSNLALGVALGSLSQSHHHTHDSGSSGGGGGGWDSGGSSGDSGGGGGSW